MWDNIKKVNICVTGFLEGEENDKGAEEKKYEEIMADRILHLVKY